MSRLLPTACAAGLVANIGDRRQTMNTPAVTMVAAWMRALTGVGPSIASGSQVWSALSMILIPAADAEPFELESGRRFISVP